MTSFTKTLVSQSFLLVPSSSSSSSSPHHHPSYSCRFRRSISYTNRLNAARKPILPFVITRVRVSTESAAAASTEERPIQLDTGGTDGLGGKGGSGGDGGGGGSNNDGDSNRGEDSSNDNNKKTAMSMSQKLTLGYAALVGVGGIVGYVKSGSQKSLAAGGLSALLLYFVYAELPFRPAFASSLGLGLSAALLGVMGSRFKKSGKIFPAGVVSLVSLIMSGGYLHGILRSLH